MLGIKIMKERMDNKISTFDEGLNYLYQAKKEYVTSFFVLTKLEVFRRLLGHIGGVGKLFHRKTKDNIKASKEIIPDTPKKLRQSPWRILAYVVCLSFIAGVVNSKILARRKQKI
jgi:hypothetical protein